MPRSGAKTREKIVDSAPAMVYRHVFAATTIEKVIAGAGITKVAQIHYVGSTDEVIDVILAESFRARFSNPEHIEIVVLEDFDHRCCWTDAWPRLAASWSVE